LLSTRGTFFPRSPLGLVEDAAAELVLGDADEHEQRTGLLAVGGQRARYVGDHRHGRDEDAARDADRAVAGAEFVVQRVLARHERRAVVERERTQRLGGAHELAERLRSRVLPQQ
jgi:hypothetical protein